MRRSTRILKREIKKHKRENEEKEKQEKKKKEQEEKEKEELERLSRQPRKKQKITEDKHKINNNSSNGGDTDEEEDANDEVTLGIKESLLLSTLSANTNLFERLDSFQKKDLSSTLTRALSGATMELPSIDLCQLAIPSFFDDSQRTFFPQDEEEIEIDENIPQFGDLPIEIIVDIFLCLDTKSRIDLARVNSFYYTIFQKWVGFDRILIAKVNRVESILYRKKLWKDNIRQGGVTYKASGTSWVKVKDIPTEFSSKLEFFTYSLLCLHPPKSDEILPSGTVDLPPYISTERVKFNFQPSTHILKQDWFLKPSLRPEYVFEWSYRRNHERRSFLNRYICSLSVTMKKSFIRNTLSEGKELSDYERDAVLKLVYDTADRCEKLLSYNWNRPYRGPHSNNAPLYPQPSLINVPLYSHQLQALHWMMNVEKLVREGRKCEFSVLTKVEGFSFGVETWRVDRNNFIDPDREIVLNPEEMVDDDEYKDSFTIKGGIFSDEMGLGKTLSILSLILSNPPLPFDTSKIIEEKEEEKEDNKVIDDSADLKNDEGEKVGEEFKIVHDEEIFKSIIDEEEIEEDIIMDDDDEEWDATEIYDKKRKSRSKSPRRRSNSPSKSPKKSKKDDANDMQEDNEEGKEEKKKALPVARKSHRSRSPISSASSEKYDKKEEDNGDNKVNTDENKNENKDKKEIDEQNGEITRKLPTARKSHRSSSPKTEEKKKKKKEEMEEEEDEDDEEEESKSPKKNRKRGRSAKSSLTSSDTPSPAVNLKKLDEVWVEEGDGKKKRRKLFANNGTLILCPGHIIEQWSKELKRRSKYPLKIIKIRIIRHLRAETYRSLVDADIVILSPTFLFSNPNYRTLVENDYQVKNKTFLTPPPDQIPLLHHIHWHRIVLDEGHEVDATRNQWLSLHSTYRWYVSGTPIPRGRLSMVNALNFLHFTVLPPKLNEGDLLPNPDDPNNNNHKKEKSTKEGGKIKVDDNKINSNNIIELDEEIKKKKKKKKEKKNEKQKEKEKEEEEINVRLLQLQKEAQNGTLPYEIVVFQAVKKLFYWRNTKNSIRQFQTSNKRSEVMLTKIKEELRIVRLTDLEKALLKIRSEIAFPLRNKKVKDALQGKDRNLNNPSFASLFLTYYLTLVKKEEMKIARSEIIKERVKEDLKIIGDFCDKYPEEEPYNSTQFDTQWHTRALRKDLQYIMEHEPSTRDLLVYLATAAPFRSFVEDEIQINVVDNNLKLEDADAPSNFTEELKYSVDQFSIYKSYFNIYGVDPKHREIKNREHHRYGLNQAEKRDTEDEEVITKLKKEKEAEWKEQNIKEIEALSNRPQPPKYTKKLIDEYAEIGYKRVYGRCGTKMAEIAKYIYVQLFYSIHLSKEESGMEFDHAKILVFAKNVVGLRNLQIALHIFDPAYFNSTKVSTIAGSSLATDKAVREFQKPNGEGIRVLLFPQRNYASGTDLHNTTHVLLIESREYSSQEEAQAYDGQAIARAHRIGQLNDVSVVRFVVENTYEQRYYENVYGPIVLPSPNDTIIPLS